jgi:hypothetical protein
VIETKPFAAGVKQSDKPHEALKIVKRKCIRQEISLSKRLTGGWKLF